VFLLIAASISGRNIRYRFAAFRRQAMECSSAFYTLTRPDALHYSMLQFAIKILSFDEEYRQCRRAIYFTLLLMSIYCASSAYRFRSSKCPFYSRHGFFTTPFRLMMIDTSDHRADVCSLLMPNYVSPYHSQSQSTYAHKAGTRSQYKFPFQNAMQPDNNDTAY
jgi:hypothetical protein